MPGKAPMFWKVLRSALLPPVIVLCGLAALAQSPSAQSQGEGASLPADPNQFIREAIQHELQSEIQDRTHWMYRLHREDEKGAQDREVIETKEGSLARTLLVNGHPLTPDERDKDEERMRQLVDNPAERAKKMRHSRQDEEKARQLLQAIPDAFIFHYEGTGDGLVQLSFIPNPHYNPPTRELQVYHGMIGKMWIDHSAMRLARIQGVLAEDVNFGFGLLGHLSKGGSFEVVQKNVGEGHWEAVMLDINMQGRAVVFKTLTVTQHDRLTDFHRVPDDLTIAQAFDLLQKAAGTVAESKLSGH